LIILGIETSCDETASSICKDGVILSSLVGMQSIHQKFGGVVPEIASREHDKILNQIVSNTLLDAKIPIYSIEGIAVTQGPGLTGTLLSGISFAKGLSLGLNIPIIGINHLEAHIFANFLADSNLDFPFICLLVSGGHTQIWHVCNLGDYKLLGETRDDAAGEAFDKGARILGLGYPGGPEIEKIALSGDKFSIKFPRPLMHDKNLEFSFSGLKTALLYYVNKNKNKHIADIAASYQLAIIEVLTSKLKWAMDKTNCDTCVIAGGVAANKELRNNIDKLLGNRRVIFPHLSLCTDNAAMVAYLGELYLKNNVKSSIDFKASPNMKMA
tara:strand:- start:2838 stop:3818 length:981 start_codon:yes stop_codon:yes gene_type:complete